MLIIKSTKCIKCEQLRVLDAKVDIIRKLNDGTVIYRRDHLSDTFIQRVAANEANFTIIYTPRGHKVPFPITLQEYYQMFKCVRDLANKGIIHRDLTPNHFLCTKNSTGRIEKIFLIKSGKMNKSILESSDSADEHHKYRGSVRFAARDILDNLYKKKYVMDQSNNFS